MSSTDDRKRRAQLEQLEFFQQASATAGQLPTAWDDVARGKAAERTPAFRPPHNTEWAKFLQCDVIEAPAYERLAFGQPTVEQAIEIWRRMESEFFARYRYFLRVEPEYCSSGVWLPPYPGSRTSGPCWSDYSEMGLDAAAIARFQAWQGIFEDNLPEHPERVDWPAFDAEGTALAVLLKRAQGEDVYVEYHPLLEVLADGSVRSCRPRLGLKD